MALRDKLGGQTVRSQSANQLASLTNSASSTKTSLPSEWSSDTNPIVPDAITITTSTKNSNQNSNQNSNTLKKSKVKANVQQSSNANANPSNHNSHSNINTSSNSNLHATSGTSASTCNNSGTNSNITSTKPLVSHGRSHSVNDIKINGNQLKLAPTPVDDIGIGVKDMKAGSRAPIALSEEL